MEDHIRYAPEKAALVLLDQRYLPLREDWFECRTVQETIYALKTMVIRGAPAIGVTAAYGCHLAALEVAARPDWREELARLLHELREARPTAVNLAWAVDFMTGIWKEHDDLDARDLAELWLERARDLQAEDIEINKAMGKNGAAFIDDGDTVMTHCNAGALATAGYGTALGVIRAAVEEGKRIKVIANETRPFLQGARLTAWELARDGIDVTIACDNACGLLMAKGLVQKVVVGADRVAANGDAANKIGTYTVACLAKRHNVPFFVAAPLSTIDRDTPSGEFIPIEQRPDEEVTHVGGSRVSPVGVPVLNYAFDVTPAELITGLVTEKRVLTPPAKNTILALFESA